MFSEFIVPGMMLKFLCILIHPYTSPHVENQLFMDEETGLKKAAIWLQDHTAAKL